MIRMIKGYVIDGVKGVGRDKGAIVKAWLGQQFDLSSQTAQRLVEERPILIRLLQEIDEPDPAEVEIWRKTK